MKTIETKMGKYYELAMEMQRIGNIREVVVISVVILTNK